MEQSTEGLKIAIVGGGISGITTAFLLAQKHRVILFEKNDYLGGHTNTRMVKDALGVEIPVDTGFIVCNHKNYPNFFKLMELWGVKLQDSEMTFGMYCQQSNLNYVGPSLREFLVTWPN